MRNTEHLTDEEYHERRKLLNAYRGQGDKLLDDMSRYDRYVLERAASPERVEGFNYFEDVRRRALVDRERVKALRIEHGLEPLDGLPRVRPGPTDG